MSEHPFLILCGGDTAEADDWESAVVTAQTLVADRLEAMRERSNEETTLMGFSVLVRERRA